MLARIVDDVIEDEFSRSRSTGRQPPSNTVQAVDLSGEEPVRRGKRPHRDARDPVDVSDHRVRKNFIENQGRFNVRPPIVAHADRPRESGAVLSVGDPIPPLEVEWTVSVCGNKDSATPDKVFAGNAQMCVVSIDPPQLEDQITSIAWTVPSFPVIFDYYKHVNNADDPNTPEPESEGKVFGYNPPPATPPAKTIGFHWGPVNTPTDYPNPSVRASVTIDKGDGTTETKDAVGYFDVDEPLLEASVVTHDHDSPKIGNCGPVWELTFGCAMINSPIEEDYVQSSHGPPGIEIFGDVSIPDWVGTGYLSYIQLVDLYVEVTYESTVTYVGATPGFHADGDDEALYPLQGPSINLHVNFNGNRCVIESDAVPSAYTFCIMQDSPSVFLQLPPGTAMATHAVYQFSAISTLMWEPAGGQLVPVSKVEWYWQAEVTTGPGGVGPGHWILVNPDHVVPSTMTKTDTWPEWIGSADDYKPKAV
jgi:hypothetical protein